MSYSSETKKELSYLKISSKIEALLELSAIARMNATVSVQSGSDFRLRFFSENEDVIYRVAKLAEFLYGAKLDIMAQQNDRLQKEPVYSTFLEKEVLENFLSQSGFDLFGNYTEPIDKVLARLQSEENARAYLRGAFLGSGSIVDPKKSYHLEIVAPTPVDMNIIQTVFKSIDTNSKTMSRRNQKVVYVKDSEKISDILVYIGATNAMLQLESEKVVKNIRNDINRKNNAESANQDKQLDAAFRQIKAIQKIEKTQGLISLPENLLAIANARLQYPDANLRELGSKIDPPISKSGVNHRMNKILRIAEDINTSSKL